MITIKIKGGGICISQMLVWFLAFEEEEGAEGEEKKLLGTRK